MVGISIGGTYANAIRFFRQHRLQLDRVGNDRCAIYLAGTPPSVARRSVAASAHLAQLSLCRVGISGARSRVTRSAVCLRALRGLWRPHCGDTCLTCADIAAQYIGVVTAWIFNISGTADLFNAFYQANHAGLMAGQLGATYFIPTFIVPLLLITHGISLRILVQRQAQPAMQEPSI